MRLIFVCCLLLLGGYGAQANEEPGKEGIYSFSVLDIDGNPVPLARYKGQVLLITNVASHCGFTDGHYKAYQKIYDELFEKAKFEILAFPCDQFGGQEPWGEDGIKKFVTSHYGVDFHMFSKIDVKGPKADPLFTYLAEKSKAVPQWNFHKYLISHEGEILHALPATTPVEEVIQDINEAIAKAIQADPDHKPRQRTNHQEL